MTDQQQALGLDSFSKRYLIVLVAAGIVTAQPDVDSVRWVFDEPWLIRHGVYID